MNLTELFLISFGLSMDCFAVSITFGSSRKLVWKDIFLMSAFFGLFQGGMPLIGWMAGNGFQWLIEPVDHWIAFAILAIIGIRMIWQSFLIGKGKKPADIRNVSVLLSLSVATSIDALITGIGFGFIRTNIFEAIIIISITTFVVTLIGAKLGEKTTFIPGRWAEFAGGVILISIGIKVVLDHMGII